MNQVVILLVQAVSEVSNVLQEVIESAGYRVLTAVDLFDAIDILRVAPVAAMIAVIPRWHLVEATLHLYPGEQFPPSIVVGDDREPVGIRARAVVTLLSTKAASQVILCLRTLLDCIGPRSDNRTLPLRMTKVPSGKFSSWLVAPPGRGRADSDWR
jgi:CheY-like chemotaxis protein